MEPKEWNGIKRSKYQRFPTINYKPNANSVFRHLNITMNYRKPLNKQFAEEISIEEPRTLFYGFR